MQCPLCSVELLLAERQGIEIDYCPKCRGIWLDRGELDKLIERAIPIATNVPTAPPTVENHKYSEELKHNKRKKSLFHDIFDF